LVQTICLGKAFAEPEGRNGVETAGGAQCVEDFN
jgi:hypothetical protein